MDSTRRRFVSSMAYAAVLAHLGARARAEEAFEVAHSDEEWLTLLGKNRFDFRGVLELRHCELYREFLGDDGQRIELCCSAGCIPQHADLLDPRNHFSEQLQPFAGNRGEIEKQAGDIPARFRQAGGKPARDRIDLQICCDDRDPCRGRSRRIDRQHRDGNDHVDVALDELGGRFACCFGSIPS